MVIYTSTMVFVIAGFTKISNEKYIDGDNHVQKKISVIIPVRNEEKVRVKLTSQTENGSSFSLI